MAANYPPGTKLICADDHGTRQVIVVDAVCAGGQTVAYIVRDARETFVAELHDLHEIPAAMSNSETRPTLPPGMDDPGRGTTR